MYREFYKHFMLPKDRNTIEIHQFNFSKPRNAWQFSQEACILNILLNKKKISLKSKKVILNEYMYLMLNVGNTCIIEKIIAPIWINLTQSQRIKLWRERSPFLKARDTPAHTAHTPSHPQFPWLSDLFSHWTSCHVFWTWRSVTSHSIICTHNYSHTHTHLYWVSFSWDPTV